MPSLKDLKNRINSVKSMQKAAAAMSMIVAASTRQSRTISIVQRPPTTSRVRATAHCWAA